jgi:hypothetical protein
LTFLEALHKKYASDTHAESSSQNLDQPIEWGGKVVEEVGFEKIRRQLALLHELKIVLLDGLCIYGAGSGDLGEMQRTCPNVMELDLSGNMLEEWAEVVRICGQLTRLRSLRVE